MHPPATATASMRSSRTRIIGWWDNCEGVQRLFSWHFLIKTTQHTTRSFFKCLFFFFKLEFYYSSALYLLENKNFDGRKINKFCFNNKTYENSVEIEAVPPSLLINNTDQSKEFTPEQGGVVYWLMKHKEPQKFFFPPLSRDFLQH